MKKWKHLIRGEFEGYQSCLDKERAVRRDLDDKDWWYWCLLQQTNIQSHSPFPRRSCWHFQHTSCFAKFGALHYASHPHPSTHSAAFPIPIQPINHRINGCFFSIPRRFRFGRVLIQCTAFVLLVFRSKQRPQTQTECLFPPFLTCLALNTRE